MGGVTAPPHLAKALLAPLAFRICLYQPDVQNQFITTSYYQHHKALDLWRFAPSQPGGMSRSVEAMLLCQGI